MSQQLDPNKTVIVAYDEDGEVLELSQANGIDVRILKLKYGLNPHVRVIQVILNNTVVEEIEQ